MRVLIAEDNPTQLSLLQNILSKWDFEAICVSDGEDAYDVLNHQDAPQLVLMDWMMPKMDGLALCDKLRQQKRSDPLYLILLTSKDQKEDIVKGLESGADDYIIKPYRIEELRARLNVGRRMITMMNNQREQEKLQGALLMARTFCHEINQPLQVISGYSELILSELSENTSNYKAFNHILTSAMRIGTLTRKVMSLTDCNYKNYLSSEYLIFDLDKTPDV